MYIVGAEALGFFVALLLPGVIICSPFILLYYLLLKTNIFQKRQIKKKTQEIFNEDLFLKNGILNSNDLNEAQKTYSKLLMDKFLQKNPKFFEECDRPMMRKVNTSFLIYAILIHGAALAVTVFFMSTIIAMPGLGMLFFGMLVAGLALGLLVSVGCSIFSMVSTKDNRQDLQVKIEKFKKNLQKINRQKEERQQEDQKEETRDNKQEEEYKNKPESAKTEEDKFLVAQRQNRKENRDKRTKVWAEEKSDEEKIKEYTEESKEEFFHDFFAECANSTIRNFKPEWRNVQQTCYEKNDRNSDVLGKNNGKSSGKKSSCSIKNPCISSLQGKEEKIEAKR